MALSVLFYGNSEYNHASAATSPFHAAGKEPPATRISHDGSTPLNYALGLKKEAVSAEILHHLVNKAFGEGLVRDGARHCVHHRSMTRRTFPCLLGW